MNPTLAKVLRNPLNSSYATDMINTGVSRIKDYIGIPTWKTYAIDISSTPKLTKGPFSNSKIVYSQEAPGTYITDDDDIWFFDAILRLEHSESQRITQHPVQTGANITDHSFALPAQLQCEVGMSDVMEGRIEGQWGSDSSEPTRSVAAYQRILYWKTYGIPLTIRTRLNTYTNMVVAHVSSPDNATMKHALKSLVTFQQIIVADVTIVKTSYLPHKTDEKNRNEVQAKDFGNNSALSEIFSGME
jgi:hypothetical protein